TRGAEDGGRDARVAQRPRERGLREHLAAAGGELVQRPQPGLRRDDQLVPVRGEVAADEPAEGLLRGAVRVAVVVREVEVRDAEVERAADDRAARLERTVVPEVVPEP